MTKEYDLDILAPELVVLTIGGKQYTMQEPTLETLPGLQRLTSEYDLDQIALGEQLTEKQIEGLKKSTLALIPDITKEIVQKLTTTQWVALQRIVTSVVRPSENKLKEFFGGDDLDTTEGETEEVTEEIAEETNKEAIEEGEEEGEENEVP